MKTLDSIKSLINNLRNRRESSSTNYFKSDSILTFETCYALWQSAIGRKIVNIKSQYPLNNTIQFDNEETEIFYKNKLEKHIRRAGQYMVAYGRGVIVVVNKNEPLSQPLMKTSKNRKMLRVFSELDVSVTNVSRDWYSDRFMEPVSYLIKGEEVHHTRVIDFSYYKLPDTKSAEVRYGGASEFQFIINQLISDNIVTGSSSAILEKSSSLYYKIKDFKSLAMNKNADGIIEYVRAMEDVRGIYGAGIIDADDDVINITQSISNLQEADTISLRRIALGSSIPMAWLIGESASGLNATGKIESETYQSMIVEMQETYYKDNINKLLNIFGYENISFKDNQSLSAEDKIKYETQVINNAQVLFNIGQDENQYLADHDIIFKDDESYENSFDNEDVS